MNDAYHGTAFERRGRSESERRKALRSKNKSKLRRVKVVVNIEASFHPYDTESDTRLAESSIVSQIRDIVNQELSYLDIQGTENGEYDLDATKKTKITVKRVK
jgi:hypothetical protein